MKTPYVVLYLEDVLAQLAHHCTELDITDNGHERPPLHCECTACKLAHGLDALLTEEWRDRCKPTDPTRGQSETSNGILPRLVGDVGVGEPGE